MEEIMRNVVKALKGLGYVVVSSRLTDEENAVWANMVASATSEQQVQNLSNEEKTWWQKQVASESCAHCWFNGQEHCLKHYHA